MERSRNSSDISANPPFPWSAIIKWRVKIVRRVRQQTPIHRNFVRLPNIRGIFPKASGARDALEVCCAGAGRAFALAFAFAFVIAFVRAKACACVPSSTTPCCGALSPDMLHLESYALQGVHTT